MWQFSLTAMAVSQKSTKPHNAKCLKYGISHLDLIRRKGDMGCNMNVCLERRCIGI